MENLIRYSQIRVDRTSFDFTRYLLNDIEWDDQLIGIRGFRGVGKTTMMLQRLKREYGDSMKAIYVTLDDFYFTKNRLFDFAEKFYLMGGRAIFMDEVHRYPNWSQEIKNIYDLYEDLKIVFSSSSALQLHKADGDLSRRAAMYNLHELSFREYLELSENIILPVYSLENITNNHINIANKIIANNTIIPLFKKYLKEGLYPFFKVAKGNYYDRLLTMINVVIESDLLIFDNINIQTVYKLRRLVAVLSDSVPFKVNISSLSRDVGLSRDVILKLIKSIDRANIVNAIMMQGSAMGYLTKPDKLYLNNTSLLYALNSNVRNFEGTLRETFFVNQLKQGHKVFSSKKADFIINDKFTFEIGGQSKGFKQIEKIDNSFICADNIEVGYGNKIPLWLMGFLY